MLVSWRVPSRKRTFYLKKDGWNTTVVSFWGVFSLFSGAKMLVFGVSVNNLPDNQFWFGGSLINVGGCLVVKKSMIHLEKSAPKNSPMVSCYPNHRGFVGKLRFLEKRNSPSLHTF